MNTKKERGIITLAAVLVSVAGLANAAVIAHEGFDTSDEGDAANGIYQDKTPFRDEPNNAVGGGTITGFQASSGWISEVGVIMPVAEGIEGGSGLSARTTSTSVLRLARNLSTSLKGTSVVYASARLRMDLEYKGTSKAQAFLGFSRGAMMSTVGAGIGFSWNPSARQWDLVVRYNDGRATVKPVKNNLGSEDTGALLVVWKMDEEQNTLDVWVDPTDLSQRATASFSDYKGSVASIENFCMWSRWLNGGKRDGVGFVFDELTLGNTAEDVMPKVPGL